MQHAKHTALLVIDLQNDYFPAGKYPLHNTEQALAHTLDAIGRAQSLQMPVILVQHVAASAASPFFAPDSEGVKIHPQVLAAAPDAPVVVKAHADSFLNTTLSALLEELKIDTLLVCGMMTQNCVTHTALSRAADGYQVKVLQDCCATVDPMIHAIALRALDDKVALLERDAALAAA